jgi:indole-3-glycerol phosphate synthase
MGTDFLTTIIKAKEAEVAAARKRISELDLRRMAASGQSRRPFFEILAKPGPSGVNIIAEIKRASPSKGPIRPDLNPADYAEAYEEGGASAISVLTDQPFFKGSLSDLQAARQASRLPVLRKDFILSPYQIYESAAAGADAVLLIVRILDQRRLDELLGLCREMDVDALVEIHSDADAAIAYASGARLIGINNRDLSSFKTDAHTAGRLASLLGPDQVPVAASGIRSRDDIEANLQSGIFNFLIGESLVRAEDPRALLRDLQEVKSPPVLDFPRKGGKGITHQSVKASSEGEKGSR